MPSTRLIKRNESVAATPSGRFDDDFQPWSLRRISAKDTVAVPGDFAPDDDVSSFRRGVVRRAEAEGCARSIDLAARETRAARTAGPFRADPPLREAALPPPPTTEYTQEQLDALRATWEAEAAGRHEAELEAARAAAYREGMEVGRHEAEATLQAAVDEAVHTLNDAATQFTHALQTYIRQTEPVLIELAFGIAEQILAAPAAEALRAIALDELATAIDHLAGDPPLDISVHPVELLRLQETGVMEQLQHTHTRLRWQPDTTLRQDEWIVQSPTAAIRRLEDELLTALRQQFAGPVLRDDAEPSASDA